MNIGDMDRLITIERGTENQDSEGATTVTWGPHDEVWAEVREERGKEAFQNGREVGSRNAMFFTHYSSNILRTDRISYDGDIWDIVNIREIGRRDGLEISASAHK